MPQLVLRLEGLTKDYGSLRALDGVSLSIADGITGLLGPNGAGKTTLIKVLLGLVQFSSGEGEVLGRPLAVDRRWIRSQVGYMPEDDCYIPGLSGVEMVQFMARLSGRSATESLRRAHEILDYCDLGQERYRDVATYSTGMRQKLKFAQAIVHDPQLLILDEPTAGLDPEERLRMLNRIRSLATSAGKVILISTHILPDVQSICEHVVIMVGGRVRLVERMEVLSRPQDPTWQVRVVGSPAALLERMQQEGLDVAMDNRGQLTIRGLDESRLDRLWQWAHQDGIALRSVTSARNSLEDVFLASIREQDRADS